MTGVQTCALPICFIETEEQAIEFAQLNLEAGRRARLATAFRAAHDYFRRGIALLGPQHWQSRHELAFALHAECFECAYISGSAEEAEAMFRAAIEHAVVLCRGDQVLGRDLPQPVRTPQSVYTEQSTREQLATGKLSMKDAEKQLMIHALQETGGNRTLAAQKLGISRRTLHRRLHEFGLEEM